MRERIDPVFYEAWHTASMMLIERLARLDPAPESPDGRVLELLSSAVEEYERWTFPIPEPTPEELEEFRRQQAGRR
jgi:hypothetical protein